LYGADAGVVCRSQAAWALWHLGYPDQGLTLSHETVTLAQQLSHPVTLCHAMVCAALLHQFRREVHCTQACAEAGINLATEQGFPHWRAQGAVLRGWALAQQGQAQAGIEQLHQGLVAYRATGEEILQPYLLTLLAEAHGIRGEREAGL